MPGRQQAMGMAGRTTKVRGGGSGSVHAHGRVLRALRRRVFPSADAFASACGSVSTPTVYRAERGGSVLLPNLERMARVLEVDASRLVDPMQDPDVDDRDLTGSWLGFYVCTNALGHPSILTEEVALVQTGMTVTGRSRHTGCGRECCDTFEDCVFSRSVFTSRLVSVDWPFPLDAPAFVLSGTRDMTWLTGYLIWFDLDTRRAEVSRYHLLRKERETFDADVSAIREALETEIKVHLLRKSLEVGLGFDRALSVLEDAGGGDPP